MPNLATAIRSSLLARGDDWIARFLTSKCDSIASELSGADLHERAETLAGELTFRGLAGRPAVLAMPTSLDFHVAAVACVYAGVPLVPSPVPRPTESISRMDGIVRDSGASVVLCSPESIERVTAYFDALDSADRPEVVDVTGLSRPLPDGMGLAGFDAAESDVVVIQYTSGSTRDPSGVLVTGENTLANAGHSHEHWHLGQDTRMFSWMPNYHDLGLFGGILYPLVLGAPTVHASTLSVIQNPIRWLRVITDHRINMSGAPPFAYAMCLDRISAEQARTLDLSSWEVAFCAADTIPADLLVRFRDRFTSCGLARAAVFASYGLAEATLFVAGERLWNEERPLGDAVDCEGVAPCPLSTPTRKRMRIVDPESRTVCQEGNEGEIWLTGPHIARGYLRKKEETARTFDNELPGHPGRWMRSGDLGVIRDGALYVTGRIKDILICNGMNVAAHDIEWLAGVQHEDLNPLAAAAFLEPGSGAGVLLVELRSARDRIEEPEPLKVRIRTAVGRTFGIDLRHIHFLRRGALERTSSGKIRRASVAARYERGEVFREASQGSLAGAGP